MKINPSSTAVIPVITNAPVKIAEPNQAQRHAMIAAQRGGGIPWATHNAQTDDQAQVGVTVPAAGKPADTGAESLIDLWREMAC